MRVILIILLLLATTLSYGQGYKVCMIYYEDSEFPNAKGLMLEQHFNKFGKIIYEKEYGYNSDSCYLLSYADSTKFRGITFHYYTQDTLLSYTLSIYRRFMDDPIPDTIKWFFYYDENQRLSGKRSTMYARYTHGICGYTPERTWGDTVIYNYEYDTKGNKIVESETGRTNRKQVIRYTYNKNNQITSETGNDEQFPYKDEYVYNKNGYLKIHTGNYGKSNPDIRTKKILYTFDNQKRIIEETELFNDTLPPIHRVYGYLPDKKILKESYVNKEDFDSTTYYYDKYGRLVKDVYAIPNHKRTHFYIYE